VIILGWGSKNFELYGVFLISWVIVSQINGVWDWVILGNLFSDVTNAKTIFNQTKSEFLRIIMLAVICGYHKKPYIISDISVLSEDW
jgi:hypothetical protein